MIHIVDALTISLTKLKTRRLRLGITVAVSSLLFALLVMLVTIINGAVASTRAYESDGYGTRYLVSVSSGITPQGFDLQDKNVWARAQTFYDQTVAAKKAAAKLLGVSYDPATEISPISRYKIGTQSQEYLNQESPAAVQALFEYSTKLRSNFEGLNEADRPYSPIATYPVYLKAVHSGSLTFMKDGREDFQAAVAATPSNASPIALSHGFSVIDDSLAKPFMFPTAHKALRDDTAIPIIVSYQLARQLLNLTPVSRSATPAQKLAQMRYVQSAANGLTVSMCYRNSVSDEQMQAALQPQQSTGSDIIYSLPNTSSCGGAIVSKDTRTVTQKNVATKQAEFDSMFGAETTPDQQKITFRVVGLTPDPVANDASPNDAFGILQSLVGSSLNIAAAVPASLYNKLPNVDRLNQIFAGDQNSYASVLNKGYVVEFGNASAARSFIDAKSCTIQSDESCGTAGRPFMLASFGSNSIALDDLQKRLGSWVNLAGLIIILIASVFAGSIVGRIISDSRKESAVFRAIGFRRGDIMYIYVIYAILLASLISICALGVGLLGAYIFDIRFSGLMTQQAEVAFTSLGSGHTFRLYRLDAAKTAAIIASVYLSVLAGSLLPIVNNARRNPIRDMREE